ncbi:hypothetical protein IFM89_025508 [Coptis chinensis]|uniref:Uncharacterized protein n=1 Tax=Coptis chinensis TaxID=261450 RepID=A0A835LJD1_9MAGN|nr:hypothetical protein IFM89_025508 [Coptis chinensis]
MGTLRGDRVFELHYDGFWMSFAHGKVNYSMYKGVERCYYEVNSEEMCYLDLLKEIHKKFGDDKPVSCVKFIARGHLTYFNNDKDMLKMWDLIKPERDKKLNHVPSITPTTPKAPNQTIVKLRKSPRLHPIPTAPMKAKKLYFEAEGKVESQLTAEDVLKDWTTVIDSGVAFEDLVDNEVEDCDSGVSEDDEVDMFIQVGDEYGPRHNKITCLVGKDQTSKKSRKADEANEANEAEDIDPEVGNAENNEGELAEEVVAEGGHDSPIRTRGGRRRGGDNNVNVQPVIDVPKAEVENLQNDPVIDLPKAEAEVENLQVPKAKRGGRAGGRRGAGQHVNLQPMIDIPEAEPEVENLQVLKVRRGGRTYRAEDANVRRYGTRSGIGRGGGRGLGWWLGEDSQPPLTLGQSTPCIVFSESLTQSQPQ